MGLLYVQCKKCRYWRNISSGPREKVCLYCYDTGKSRGEVRGGKITYSEVCERFDRRERKNPFHESWWGNERKENC